MKKNLYIFLIVVPVLINALKEQQSEIDVLKKQESKYLEQDGKISRLENLVEKLISNK